MTARRVLLFSPYPIEQPVSGGQKRASAVAAMLRRAFGAVTPASVMIGLDHRAHGTHDIALKPAQVSAALASGHTDLYCGRAISADPATASKVRALLTMVQPEVLVLEQPYAWAGLKPLLAELGLDPVIVYDAQNIESTMRRESLAGAGPLGAADLEAIAAIEQLERELAERARVVVACTEADAEVLRGWGADPVVAGNGIDRPADHRGELSRWREELRDKGIRRTVAFVSSAHPPNVHGLLELVGEGLGFLEPDTRLVLAGTVGEGVARVLPPEPDPSSSPRLGSVTFWRRTLDCGRVNENRLGAILRGADVVVLPVTSGGGSNLKTAEAILAERPVVASHRAMRSFEQFESLPDVALADDPATFRAAIQAALTTEPTPRTEAQRVATEQLLWPARLAAFEAAMRQL